MKENTEFLLEKVYKKHIWDEEPVFCFTSDIDWASEYVMEKYFEIVNTLDINPTLFVTHNSEIIKENFNKGKITRGLHPNFMSGSSHGNSFNEVANTCIAFAPEAFGFRSHRAFDLTDITHLMRNDHDFKYVSHQITVFQPSIKPILHESGLINFPVFFEDGTHLYNNLELHLDSYKPYFMLPGIKIISFHPMNFIFNSPKISFMRSIKDSLSREEYHNITFDTIKLHQNNSLGIRNTILEIIDYVKANNFTVMNMNELYNQLIK